MTRLRAGALAATLLILGSTAGAADVLVVQASRLRAYDEAVAAFLAALPPATPIGPKQAGAHVYTQIALTDPQALELLERRRKERPPDLVLALGAQALQATVGTGAPVVYALVANPEAVANGRSNVTGVPLAVSASASLDALLASAPRVRRVAILHDPRRTAGLVAAARKEAVRRGITLVVREARAAADVPALLKGLEGQADALWMLPDLTVSAPEAVDAVLLFALRHHLPVLTFSEKYLGLGAAVAVAPDPSAMGRKAAELADRVLAGQPPSAVHPAPADQVRTAVNASVLRHLGLGEASR